MSTDGYGGGTGHGQQSGYGGPADQPGYGGQGYGGPSTPIPPYSTDPYQTGPASPYTPNYGTPPYISPYGPSDPHGNPLPIPSLPSQPTTTDIATALATAIQSIQQIQQVIGGGIYQETGDCCKKIENVQKYIFETISKIYQSSSTCYSNCQQSIVQQIANMTGQSLSQAETATSNCPACPPCPPVTVSPPSVTVNIDNYPAKPPIDNRPVAPSWEQYNTNPEGYSGPPSTNIVIDIPLPKQPFDQPVTGPTPGKEPFWNGYCNRTTGAIQAVRADDLQPGPPWEKVSGPDSQANALSKASVVCTKKTGPDGSKPDDGPGVSTTSQRFAKGYSACDLPLFQNHSDLAAAFSRSTAKIWMDQVAFVVGKEADHLSGLISHLDISGAIGQSIAGLLKGPLRIAEEIAPQLAEILGCKDEIWQSVLYQRWFINYVEERFNIDATPFKRILDYAANHQCRQVHLSHGEAMAAYLSNAIGFKDLDTLCAIHGLCPQDVNWLIQSERAKPIPHELITMRRRKIIDPSEYSHSMRELGYIDNNVVEKLFKATEEIPPVQDIIRFMVRDTDDKEIVDSLELDALFDHKFGPTLKEWAENHGIQHEMMVHEWRAHWVITPPSQLFEFWRRLRRNPDFAPKEELEKRIRQALIHNDILPIWHDAYFAVQYHPLTRRDAQRGFMLGVLDAKQLNDVYAQLGYDDDNCDLAVDLTKRYKREQAIHLPAVRLWTQLAISYSECKSRLDKLGFNELEITNILADSEHAFINTPYCRAFLNGSLPWNSLSEILISLQITHDGIESIRQQLSLNVKTTPDVEDYRTGLIDRDSCSAKMREYGAADFRINFILDEIDARMKHSSINSCISGIRKRYRTGELDADQAANALGQQGIVPERVQQLVASWKCESVSKGKQPALTVLCNWVSNGIITGQQFIDRAVKIGYPREDAMILLGDCLAKINANISKQAMKDAKDEAAREEKQRRLAEKTQAAINRENAQIYRANEASKRKRLAREKQLQTAAGDIQRKCSCDLETALATAAIAKRTIQDDYKLGLDETLQLMLAAAAKWNGGDPQNFLHEVFGLAELTIQSQIVGTVEEQVSQPN